MSFLKDELNFIYTMPPRGGELKELVADYCFISRDIPPSFETIRSCMTKALKAGIVLCDKDQFKVEDNWYHRIHLRDNSSATEIHAMLDFTDDFLGVDIDVINEDLEFSPLSENIN